MRLEVEELQNEINSLQEQVFITLYLNDASKMGLLSLCK